MTKTDSAAEPAVDFQKLRLAAAQVNTAILAGHAPRAVELASAPAASALSDLAVAMLAGDDFEQGIRLLEQAVKLHPPSQSPFHNLVAALLSRGSLRGANLQAVQKHLTENWKTLPWAPEYRRLLFLPYFLNVEFVFGRCNLKCRMCVGSQGDKSARRLEHISVDDFRAMLTAAPTICGLTLSSGDSEPLLHPEFEQIIEVARQHRTPLDVFTNGLALTAAKCRQMIEAKIVQMINFSVDAATPETYRRIRGEDLPRLIKRIDMLRKMKAEIGSDLPWVSMSFVAMADNIEELPAFVEMARDLAAKRVYVEDLIGWEDGIGPNQPATKNPGCFEFIRAAQRIAAQAKLSLKLPKRLSPDQPTAACDDDLLPASAPPADDRGGTSPSTLRLASCSWMSGVWVQRDGRLDPCCLVHNVADMGNVKDGLLLENDRFVRVKSLLMSGKVFPECAGQSMCVFVQQQLAAGIPLRFITSEELGDLCAPAPARAEVGALPVVALPPSAMPEPVLTP